jgi:hypothetical protein
MADDEPVIVDSARKHGITDEDILHALRNYIRVLAEDERGFSMVIGPAYDAQLLEVGVVESTDGDLLVIHAMVARRKFLKR